MVHGIEPDILEIKVSLLCYRQISPIRALIARTPSAVVDQQKNIQRYYPASEHVSFRCEGNGLSASLQPDFIIKGYLLILCLTTCRSRCSGVFIETSSIQGCILANDCRRLLQADRL